MKRERGERTRRTRAELAAMGSSESPRPGSTSGERRFSTALVGWLRGAFLANVVLKLLALTLALTVFILVHADDQAVAGGTVDVNYKLPKERVLVSERVDQVRITVKGPPRRIKRFHREDVEPINIDLSNVTKGEIFFQPDMIDLPEGLELVSITPASLPVEFEDRAVKPVPITIDTANAPGRGFKVNSMTARPAQVRVSGAASVVAETRSVRTAEIDLAGRTKSFRETVRLDPPDALVVDGDPVVEVDITLGEEQGSREMSLPIVVRAAPGMTAEQVARFRTDPSQVRVVLRGSVLVVDALSAEHMSANVRVFPNDLTGTAPRMAEVRVEPALPGIGYEISPAEVTLRATP
jgi:YbbR domain-containing protein